MAPDEFYPTPPDLASKMLDGIDFRQIHTVLEPSAGSGGLVLALSRQIKDRFNHNRLDVDCVELDPNLRAVLKYRFSDLRKIEVQKAIQDLQGKRKYDCDTRSMVGLSAAEEQKLKQLTRELETDFLLNGVHIVHDDFLSFRTFKKYDLILMNPPFSNGDKHLLKAISMQKRTGGGIVCLLNAETLLNPYTRLRKDLVDELQKA